MLINKQFITHAWVLPWQQWLWITHHYVIL